MVLIYIFVGLVAGGIIGYVIRQSLASKKVGSAEAHAERIVEDAKSKEKELIIDAKAKALEITESAKKAETDFRSQIVRFEDRIDRKEKELDRKSEILETKATDLEKQKESLGQSQEEIKELRVKQLANLEKIAGMTKDEAGKVLLDNAERGIKDEMLKLHRKLLNTAHEDADREARKIVAQAIERVATEVTAETTTTTVNIPSEDNERPHYRQGRP